MGRMYAEGLAASGYDLKTLVSVHLSSNCYPKVPEHMVPICVTAIERVNEGNRKRIRLPEGTRYRGSHLVDPVDVVDSLYLHAFIDRDEV